MSFENFQLEINIVSELYKDSVFILEDSQAKQPSLDTHPYKSLGGFKKHILILVADEQNTWLSDTDMNLLTAILSACKLNMNDIAIANAIPLGHENVPSFIEMMNPSSMIIFGDIKIGLSDQPEPIFNIQQDAKMKWLRSPSLALLANLPASKKALWISLKNLFEI